MDNPFSCFLIGSDTLLAQCGEILLSRGHTIRGVITASARIAQWAADRSLPTIPADSDYPAVLEAKDFDFLFAITHLELIPARATSSPRRLAINFHDGPLPAYAGLNAPMWALMNGETDYGISWHVVGSGIDDGDLLLQYPVAIGEQDTALSLNTKCFAAALESFPVLVEQLAAGKEKRQAQTSAGRTYFGRFKRPSAACVLDWRKPASELERQVRALNVGRYPNPVGSPKLLAGGTAFVVDSATAAIGHGKPGHVIGTNDTSITVAAGEGALVITALSAVDGSAVDMATARAALGAGQSVGLADDAVEPLTTLAELSARDEPFWAKRLQAVETVDLPYRRGAPLTSGDRRVVDVAVPAAFQRLASSEPFAVAGAFLQFIGRVLGRTRFDVALSGQPLADGHGGFSALFATHGFLNVEIETEASAWDQSRRLVDDARSQLKRKPWLRDLVAREPALKSNSMFARGTTLPLAIALGDAKNADVDRAEMVLCVAANGHARLAYAEAAYAPESIEQLLAHFGAVLETMAANPASKYRELDLVNEADRQKLLYDLECDRSRSRSGRTPSRGIRAASAQDTGRRRDCLRGPRDHVPRFERASDRSGGAAARAWRRPGRSGRRSRVAIDRTDGRDSSPC